MGIESWPRWHIFGQIKRRFYWERSNKKGRRSKTYRTDPFCNFSFFVLSGVWKWALLGDPAYHRHFGLNEREWMETLDLINWAWVRPAALLLLLATNFGCPSWKKQLMHPSSYSQVLLNWLEDVMASKIGLFNLLLILVVGALVVTTASQTCPSICTCKWKNGKISIPSCQVSLFGKR